MAGDLGNTGALCIFAAVLLGKLEMSSMPVNRPLLSFALSHVVCSTAYTLQTELAQIVQQSQDYRKPYFLFYMTHRQVCAVEPG